MMRRDGRRFPSVRSVAYRWDNPSAPAPGERNITARLTTSSSCFLGVRQPTPTVPPTQPAAASASVEMLNTAAGLQMKAVKFLRWRVIHCCAC